MAENKLSMVSLKKGQMRHNKMNRSTIDFRQPKEHNIEGFQHLESEENDDYKHSIFDKNKESQDFLLEPPVNPIDASAVILNAPYISKK